jgi:hypothetical protein
MKRTALKKQSPRQAVKQSNWNNLVTFLSRLTEFSYFYQTECCNSVSTIPLDGAHIIGKARAGCTWTAKNCLLVSRWCGCHSHQQYGDGLSMGIVVALEIAKQRNARYGINPEYNGSQEMSPYLKGMGGQEFIEKQT